MKTKEGFSAEKIFANYEDIDKISFDGKIITIIGDYIGNNIVRELHYKYPNNTITRLVFEKMEELLTIYTENKTSNPNVSLTRLCLLRAKLNKI